MKLAIYCNIGGSRGKDGNKMNFPVGSSDSMLLSFRHWSNMAQEEFDRKHCHYKEGSWTQGFIAIKSEPPFTLMLSCKT